MASIGAEQLLRTSELLQSLQCSIPGGNNALIVESLLQALSQDGFQLQPFVHHLRGLAEEEPNMNDPVEVVSNLIPVIVCVICAGFASGLTQVRI